MTQEPAQEIRNLNRASPEVEAMLEQQRAAERAAYAEIEKREAERQLRGAALMYACQTAGNHDHQTILAVARDFLAFLTGTEAQPLDS